jgi:hypothetical protein
MGGILNRLLVAVVLFAFSVSTAPNAFGGDGIPNAALWGFPSKIQA